MSGFHAIINWAIIWYRNHAQLPMIRDNDYVMLKVHVQLCNHELYNTARFQFKNCN